MDSIAPEDVRTLVAAVEYYRAIVVDRTERVGVHVDPYLARFVSANKPSHTDEALSRAREFLEANNVDVPPRLDVVRYP